MKSLKHIPRNQAKIIEITPKLLLKKEAMKYVGLERKTFDKIIIEKGLSVYAYGTKKYWYRLSELDELMESFLIRKKPLLVTKAN